MMAHIQIGIGLLLQQQYGMLLQQQYEEAAARFEKALQSREGSEKRMQLVRKYHACCLYEAGKQAFEGYEWAEAVKLFEKAVETKALPAEYRSKAKERKKQCMEMCKRAKKGCRLDGKTDELITPDAPIRGSKAFDPLIRQIVLRSVC